MSKLDDLISLAPAELQAGARDELRAMREAVSVLAYVKSRCLALTGHTVDVREVFDEFERQAAALKEMCDHADALRVYNQRLETQLASADKIIDRACEKLGLNLGAHLLKMIGTHRRNRIRGQVSGKQEMGVDVEAI